MKSMIAAGGMTMITGIRMPIRIPILTRTLIRMSTGRLAVIMESIPMTMRIPTSTLMLTSIRTVMLMNTSMTIAAGTIMATKGTLMNMGTLMITIMGILTTTAMSMFMAGAMRRFAR